MAYNITLINSTTANASVSKTNPNAGENVKVFLDTISDLTILDNDNDVTDQFVYTTGETKTFVATSYIGTASSYTTDTVGHTAENPGSTGTGNWWVNGGSYINFKFDFSSIPVDATITSVQVKAFGGRESSTTDSTHRARIGLYTSSGTLKGSTQEFTTTSNQIITLTNPGTWTRSELQGAYLSFSVAYYGGRIHGISWNVTYTLPTGIYIYTIPSVSADHVINIDISGIQTLYIKKNGTWVQVINAYKKVNGIWTISSKPSLLFDKNTNYRTINV